MRAMRRAATDIEVTWRVKRYSDCSTCTLARALGDELQLDPSQHEEDGDVAAARPAITSSFEGDES